MPKNIRFFIQKKEVFLENSCSWISKIWINITFTFSKIFEKYLWRIPFLVKFLTACSLNFFTDILHRFRLFFRNSYLKERFWVAASFYFSWEISHGSIHFLGKCYSREYLNLEITLQSISRGVLISRRDTYLLLNKYCGSSYFSVNNYWGVLILIQGYTGNTALSHRKYQPRKLDRYLDLRQYFPVQIEKTVIVLKSHNHKFFLRLWLQNSLW